jgi:hypothetical protein
VDRKQAGEDDMIDSLLGVELPLPVKLIVAFVIVLALIALATWIFRRLGGERVGPSIGRGRQPRLAVIDAASVDGRRRLVLVRRDNVEHLVMIGGPSDIVIEQNIVRAVPVAPPGPRPMAEPTVRPVAPEAVQPRPVPEPYRERAERAAAEPRPRLEPLPRTPRAETTRLAPAEPPPPRPARLASARRAEPEARRAAVEVETSTFEAHAASGPDTSLADMASKLEAALRRPPPARVEPELQGPTPPTVPAAEPAGPPKPPAAAPAPIEPAAQATPAAASQEKDKPAANGNANPGSKSMFDSLEEEMASLLGKPPGKP